MNYIYEVGNEKFVLTEVEHDTVRKIIDSGKVNLITLRGGDIAINPAFIRSIKKVSSDGLPEDSVRWESKEGILIKLPSGPNNTKKEPVDRPALISKFQEEIGPNPPDKINRERMAELPPNERWSYCRAWLVSRSRLHGGAIHTLQP